MAALILCAALNMTALSACGDAGNTDPLSGDAGSASPAVTAPAAVPSASDAASPRTPAEIDLTGAAAITLSGNSVQISGSGAEESDGVITITAGGTYTVSGTLEEGRIIVNAAGEDVTLALNGASITCSYGSPIYIYKSSGTTIHLVEGTENTLADGEEYTFADSLSSAADEEPNACLYSKSDLLLQGAGALTVEPTTTTASPARTPLRSATPRLPSPPPTTGSTARIPTPSTAQPSPSPAAAMPSAPPMTATAL